MIWSKHKKKLDEQFPLLESTEFYNHRYQNFSISIILPIFSLLMVLLGIAYFAKIETNVTVKGQIVPIKKIITIRIPSHTKVDHLYIYDGKYVTRGSTLFTYSNREQKQRKKFKARVSGYIHMDEIEGQQINNGTIGELYPSLKSSSLEAISFVNDQQVDEIKRLSNSHLIVHSNFKEAIVINGRVESVAAVPTMMNGKSMYKIVSKYFPTSHTGDIKYGEVGKIVINTGKMTLLNYAIKFCIN